jgi:hypothetical protein
VSFAPPLADEHLDRAADLRLHPVVRDAVLQRDQPVVALAHDLLRQRRQVGGGRAGPAGVLEGEGAREARGLDAAQGVLEVGVGLAGEADDDVGGDGGVGHRRPHPVEDPRKRSLR